MKIRMIETTVSPSWAPPKSGQPGVNRSPALRPSLALVKRFGPPFSGVAVLTLITVLFLAAWTAPHSPRKPSPGRANGFSGWGCPPGKTLYWYVNDGQLKADARTALAIARYVLSPDFDPWITPVVPQPAPFLTATTNSATNMPRV